MMPAEYGWVIIGAPLLAFVVTALIFVFFGRAFGRLAAALTIGLIAVSFVLSLWAWLTVWNGGGEPQVLTKQWDWIRINAPDGGTAVLQLGLHVDPLTTVLLILATAVSLLVQIYSLGYMKGEIGFPRYYAFMALFTFAMLGLVLADNLLQLFIFWELVGLCSYLLIGHWYDRPAPAAAQLKAFLTTRVGDVAFL